MKKITKVLLFLLSIILFLGITLLYGMFIGTKGLTIKEYKIVSNKITEEYHGLKIAHISDIHYGRTTNKKDLETIVEKINLLKPDIVVLTGDLVDDEINEDQMKEISDSLKKIKATIGKYAIDGNHDYSFKKWDILIENCGFKDLRDTYDLIYANSYEPILIAGISNNTHTKKNIQDKIEPIMKYLDSFTEETEEIEPIYKILLLHEPDFADDIDNQAFDLILAGHSHNGQVRLPWIGAIYTPYGSKKYYDEYYKIEKTDLYVSSGIGTSTFGIRLFNRPSFNFYRLTNH